MSNELFFNSIFYKSDILNSETEVINKFDQELPKIDSFNNDQILDDIAYFNTIDESPSFLDKKRRTSNPSQCTDIIDNAINSMNIEKGVSQKSFLFRKSSLNTIDLKKRTFSLNTINQNLNSLDINKLNEINELDDEFGNLHPNSNFHWEIEKERKMTYIKTSSPYLHLLKQEFELNDLNINSDDIINEEDSKGSQEKSTLTTSTKPRGILRNPRSGNPINKIIQIINEKKEDENLLDLANSNSEYFNLGIERDENSKRKILFKSKKLSNADIRKLSRRNCCSCKKSHCLKLYCECFKAGDYCKSCTCPNCLNKDKYEAFRQQSINFLKNKSKHAFKSIVEVTSDKKEKHIKGCKCKNSSCQKNYCECFQNGMKCSDQCKCENCMNGEKKDISPNEETNKSYLSI